MPKSTRITISGRNLQFLQELAEQMDESNLASVMTYLLTDIRGLGYKFGDKPAPTAPQPQAPIGYSFNPSAFEPAFAPIRESDTVGALRDGQRPAAGDRNQLEIDPIIARMASLIEEF
ncbi:MAG: hypothetical protein KME22_03915 [Hassallia sp. WJT32-NPBG1]|jgi:hypothetical protein|nr:hypothetical protein [Spirirestis rafaelensis WJT71-NPBG6]MBW4606378.1 hypothetical protein [Hassallia sp. WJT32-NPBG1]